MAKRNERPSSREKQLIRKQGRRKLSARQSKRYRDRRLGVVYVQRRRTTRDEQTSPMSVRRLDLTSEEEHGIENIEFMLNFLEKGDRLSKLDDIYLGVLANLLNSCLDNDSFNENFPQMSIEAYRTKTGKELPSGKGKDKSRFFRESTIWKCAEKIKDMLRPYASEGKLNATNASYGGRDAIYNSLYGIAITISNSATSIYQEVL